MSGAGLDTADDLHEAEDLALGLAQHAAVVVEFGTEHPWTGLGDAPGPVRDAINALVPLVTQAGNYCRPTCGAEGDPASEECDDDTCGCPCGHAEGVARDLDPPEFPGPAQDGV